MRYWMSAIVLTMLVVGGCQPASRERTDELTDAQRDEIASQVKEAVDGLFVAMNARDPDRVLSHYVEDDDFAYVGTINLRPGREGFASMVRAYYPRHPEVTFTHRIVHTQVLSPTTAVVFSQGGSSDVEFLAWTHVLVRREGGRWLITYEHEAWPGAEPPSQHPGM